jgi:hypothetical protein
VAAHVHAARGLLLTQGRAAAAAADPRGRFGDDRLHFLRRSTYGEDAGILGRSAASETAVPADLRYISHAVPGGGASARRVSTQPVPDLLRRGLPSAQGFESQTPVGRRPEAILRRSAEPMAIRRLIKYGTDPRTRVTEANGDLLYGINGPRAITKSGLDADQRKRLRTIDDYNRAVGINGVMRAATAAMGLHRVRLELASTAAWGFPIDGALNTAENEHSIQAWVTYLRAHRAHIGLEDLGEKRFFRDKIDEKDRFKKNRKESQAKLPKSDQLTPKETRDFLSAGHTVATAQLAYDAMSNAKQTALNEWVYRAFFRRTSKLGQDFTLNVLNADIHFNTVADPDYKPLLGPQWKDHGLKNMSKKGENSKNRSITVSEFRHMKKLAKQNPGRFNVYGEF